MATRIRVVLLTAGLGIFFLWLGCGGGYYTYYPDDWVPAGCPSNFDEDAMIKTRAQCRLEAIERPYPDRGDVFVFCMQTKGYREQRKVCPK
ncbi:MAG: hypothetical protein ACYSX0_09235 [Planctomycetota bacterium]|jgi:hypothetical protein